VKRAGNTQALSEVGVVRRLNRPRIYQARNGLGAGFRQIGGIGLALPRSLRSGEPTAEERFLRDLQLDGMTIFDVGAFQGALSMFFAARAGADGQVIAFEPHPFSYGRILTHLDLNGVSNVDVRNVAIGSKPGTLRLVGSPSGDGTTTANEALQRGLRTGDPMAPLREFSVRVTSIDAEMQAGDMPHPDFVKIDVEGMELQVLEGMDETIRTSKPALYIEMHGAGEKAKRINAEAVIGFLVDHDYDLQHVESGRPISMKSADSALEGHLYCVPAPN
jgi:FkbM family methyltransferase